MGTPYPEKLPRLLLILSATTGLVDAASVLGLGKVFTANMTGNIVFLGFAAVGAPGFKVLPALVALAFFMIGAWGAGVLGRAHGDRPLRRWLLIAALAETGLLWFAAAVSLEIDHTAAATTGPVFSVIALTALAMGLRNATVRQLKVPDLTTTVLTLTVTGIAADVRTADGAKTRNRRLGAIASIFLGAVTGGALLLHVGVFAPLLLGGLMVMLATLAFTRDPATALPHRS